GKEITYTWTESGLPEGYELTDTSADGTVTTLTNTHEPEETEATVKKVWDDAENQDGKRPDELKVKLSNGTEVTLNEANGWTAKVEHLPKYADGKEITYTWTESGLPEGYELTGNSADGTVTTLTNTHTPEETEATVKKVWDDAENQDGKRPDELKVKLSNGTEVTLNEANGWTAKVEHLPKYADGKEITYTWTESGLPEGYELTDTSADGTVTTLTNTHEIEKTKVEGAKTWSDSEDADEIRPASITIHLMVGETEIDKKTVTEADGWKWSFTDLDKYADGKEIEYTITEDKVDGYDQTISGYDVTNTHLLTRVRVEKELTEILRGDEVIADHSKAKAGDVITYTVRLTNIGEADLPTGAEVKDTMTRTLSDGSKTETVRTFASTKDLAPGEYEEFTYTYTVQDNDGYLSNAATTDIPGDPPPPPVEVPIVKTVTIVKAWKDRNNADKQRPESLTVTLLADGKPVQDVTLNEGNEWTAEVEDLMVLTEDGQPITYSWSEVEVEGYTLVSTTTEGNVTTMTNRQDDSPTPVMNVFLNIGECYE
ncbi:MAG: Cna B-type domain-containing protein, partial [Clostridia bacterium]|nr:Cna B-type domain-containing protein [Clostridia bacterium]